jgi:hypothetical protein
MNEIYSQSSNFINFNNNQISHSPSQLEQSSNEYFDQQNNNIKSKIHSNTPTIIKNKNIINKLSFKDFIEYIIYIVKSLQNGVGLNVIFSQNNKLIYIGIILILISILLLPIIY